MRIVGLASLLTAVSVLSAHAGDAASLYYLQLSGKVVRADGNGSQRTVLVDAAGVGPDGIAIDERAGHIYWTNMGKVGLDDGAIMRANLDGSNVTVIIAPGGTFTPKQLKIDTRHRKLYWSDREGMRVMRANLDGSNIETLIVTGRGDAERKDQSRWCVGIALDVERGHVYWTQKGGDNANQGVIKRAGLDVPRGQTADNRTDIEVLFAGLPEPIDLELDLQRRHVYWTDRGDNTVSRAPLDPPKGYNPTQRKDRVILARGMKEAIGIALDFKTRRIFYTSLGGELGVVNFDGGDAKLLHTADGALTGIAVIEHGQHH